MIKFINTRHGNLVSQCFQPFMKKGTNKINDLRYESFLYPENAEEMKVFMDEKYKETMDLWQDEDGI